MLELIRRDSRLRTVALLLTLLAGNLLIASASRSAEEKGSKQTESIAKGQHVFSCGHSFHVFVPGILSDMAKAAGIEDHVVLGLSAIGGSRVIQHWDVAEEQNKELGKKVLFAVPVGQAVIALREKIIAGQIPGLKTQEDLFTDPIGHAQPPLQTLVAYCHFAVIYRCSPVGLPMPAVLATANNPNWDEKLNHLLQELAWDAVIHHPLSGVEAQAKP